MSTQSDYSRIITPAGIDAVMAVARQQRAEAMRVFLTALPGAFKRLAVKLRPNRGRLPQAGAWA